jgi:hypothetical protein
MKLDKSALWIGTGTCLALLSVALVARTKTKRAWERVVASAEAARVELDRRDDDRVALWGETTSGNAFEAYAEAVEALGECTVGGEHGVYFELSRVTQWDGSAESRDRLALLVAQPAVQAALDALERGAHARDARWTIARDATTNDLPSLAKLNALSRVAWADAVVRASAGEDVAAARRLLDVVQLGGDLFEAPTAIMQAIGMSLLNWTGGDLGPFPSDFQLLGPEGRVLFAAGLDGVAARLDLDGDMARGELVLLVNAVEQQRASGESVSDLLDGHAARCKLIEVAGRYDQFAARFDGALALGVPAALEEAAAFERAMHATRSVMSGRPPLTRDWHAERVRTIARIDGLRALLAVEQGSPPPRTTDPLGEAFDIVAGPGDVALTFGGGAYRKVELRLARAER